MPIRTVAILGAGLAGLACARTLAAHGVAVRIFDKGRAPGGRLATRRVEAEGRSFAFDHGAQYLTARGALFRALLDAAGAQDWPEPGRRVGVPRMSALPRALAEGLPLDLSRHAVALSGGAGAWTVRHAPAEAVRPGRPVPPGTPIAEDGPFDAVALAMPAPQAADLLLGPAPQLAARLERVRIAPCWTLMAAFADRLSLPDTIRLAGGAVTWAARDGSKPGRGGAETWVVQAGPDWSRTHLELAPAEAEARLREAFAALAGGTLPAPVWSAAHRWRYALVEAPLGAPCLWDPGSGLGAAGDWCIEARAEAAAESGAALAAAIRAA